VPPEETETVPWQQLCVDLIRPYKIPINSKGKAWKKKLFDELWYVTMIHPATSWFEVVEIFNKMPMKIANIVEMTWINRYLRSGIITFDGGSEFKAEFKKVMREEFNLKVKAISVRHPQANAVLETIHQNLGNMLKTF